MQITDPGDNLYKIGRGVVFLLIFHRIILPLRWWIEGTPIMTMKWRLQRLNLGGRQLWYRLGAPWPSKRTIVPLLTLHLQSTPPSWNRRPMRWLNPTYSVIWERSNEKRGAMNQHAQDNHGMKENTISQNETVLLSLLKETWVKMSEQISEICQNMQANQTVPSKREPQRERERERERRERGVSRHAG